MRRTRIKIAEMAFACSFLGCVAGRSPLAADPTNSKSPSVERGRAVYAFACASCHGEAGDGRGRFAAQLDPPPRDFTRGVFRYRSTPSGSLPLDTDLARTVLNGLPGTSMPAWRGLLTGQEVRDVVALLKTLSPWFSEEEPEEALPVPVSIAYSASSVETGRTVYEKLACGRCHGAAGRGDGWGADEEMKDSEGNVIRPRDFTVGVYRSGTTKQDIYRVLMTGLDGTPMPAYDGSVTAEEAQHLVNYLLSLEKERGLLYWLLTPPRWYEPGDHQVAR